MTATMTELKAIMQEALRNCKNNNEIVDLIENTNNRIELHFICELSTNKSIQRLASVRASYLTCLIEALKEE